MSSTKVFKNLELILFAKISRLSFIISQIRGIYPKLYSRYYVIPCSLSNKIS